MTEELWGGVDRYVSDHLIPTDFMSEAAVIASEAAGLPMPSPLLDTGAVVVLSTHTPLAGR